MNQERLLKIIQGPVVSEKSNNLSEKQEQIALKVLPDANKKEIKAAVEWNVAVNKCWLKSISPITKLLVDKLPPEAVKTIFAYSSPVMLF